MGKNRRVGKKVIYNVYITKKMNNDTMMAQVES